MNRYHSLSFIIVDCPAIFHLFVFYSYLFHHFHSISMSACRVTQLDRMHRVPWPQAGRVRLSLLLLPGKETANSTHLEDLGLFKDLGDLGCGSCMKIIQAPHCFKNCFKSPTEMQGLETS